MSRALRLAAAVAAVLLQLVVLYIPQAPSVSAPTDLPLDKAVHVLVFALPTAALILVGAPRRPVVVVMALHALVSELIQALVLPMRSGDPRDVIADLVGIALGTLAVRTTFAQSIGGSDHDVGHDRG